MTHNLRALGLALLAALALSAVVASAAQALENRAMTAGNVEAFIEGDQVAGENHVFTVEGGSTEMKCKTVHFVSANEANEQVKIASPWKTLTTRPTYASCNSFGGCKRSGGRRLMHHGHSGTSEGAGRPWWAATAASTR